MSVMATSVMQRDVERWRLEGEGCGSSYQTPCGLL